MKVNRQTIKFNDIEFFINKKQNKIICYIETEQESLDITACVSKELVEYIMLSDEEFNALNFGGYMEGHLELNIKIEKEGFNTYIYEKTEPNLISFFLKLYKDDIFIKEIDFLETLCKDKKNKFEDILVEISDRRNFLFN